MYGPNTPNPDRFVPAPFLSGQIAAYLNPAITAIYAKLPAMRCKGLCQESCGPIGMSHAEARQIIAHVGILPDVDESLTCTMLDTGTGRCTIYEHRPMVCRLWGMTKKMRCPHGCTPDGGFVSDRKAHKLLARLDALQQAQNSVIAEVERVVGERAQTADQE